MAQVILIGAIIIFVVFQIVMVRTIFKNRKKEMEQTDLFEYEVACAGSYYSGMCNKDESVACGQKEFYDQYGHLLNEAEFEKFIVKGDSMKLCGINDNDLLFVDKNEKIKPEILPQILVIRRYQPKDGEPRFKIRRTWKICTMNDDFRQILNDIINSETFKCVKEEKEYAGDEKLMNDFINERLTKYKETFSDSDVPNSLYNKVIISTTLHTDINEIRFSLHPVDLIEGVVKASFTIGK